MSGRVGVFILILTVCVVGVLAGTRYFKYTEEDPDFCSTCHAMNEGFKTWVNSQHSQYVCQRCHTLSIVEENKLLVAFVAKGSKNVEQDHGRTTPWEGCLKCHNEAATQGSLTLRVSHGHAKHVFQQDIPCKKCHRGDNHDFTADQNRCQTCHTDKLVHGMGMAGLYCLNCHSYAETSEKMVSIERCFGCHGDIPMAGVMAGITCFDCHHPHGKLKMQNEDCMGSCHGNETRVGQHKRHMEGFDLGCLDCHRPHTWRIGQEEAPGLCDRCHPLKDPATFIY